MKCRDSGRTKQSVKVIFDLEIPKIYTKQPKEITRNRTIKYNIIKDNEINGCYEEYES